jgi:hypothetical protein
LKSNMAKFHEDLNFDGDDGITGLLADKGFDDDVVHCSRDFDVGADPCSTQPPLDYTLLQQNQHRW